jgi:16S rRNA (adenine(1408)-N(1))-methyltransferase
VEEPSDNSTLTPSENSLLLTGEGIVIDIGTGDGLFVYQCARRNPKKFFIGIDANPRPLEKISERIHRKPAKGGAPNALFLQAAIEDLPDELDGVADEIHIHFPWGSLLQAVALGDQKVLRSLRRLCSPGALLEIIVGLDQERDRAEIERLNIPPLSTHCITSTLSHHFKEAGFEIFETDQRSPANWPALQTSWAKRLEGSSTRSLIYIIARALG